MLDIFKEYDINEVNPIMGISRYKSGSTGMGRMIDLGVKNQDRNKPFQPFIILEDDVSFYRQIPETIEIPDDSDLFYIGISMCGVINNTDRKLLYAKDVNDEIVKIYNMLSTHGIMICSASGALAFQRCMVEGYVRNMSWDIPVANIQPYYNVYALKKPLVYQDITYNGCQSLTKFELKNYVSPDKQKLYKSDISYSMYNKTK